MTKEGYKKILTVAFYVWVVTLYVLTALPGKSGPEKFSDSPIRWDYFEHFFLFMGIPVVYFLSGGAGIKAKTARSGMLLIAAGLVYAVLAEVQQIIVPGRAYNPVDLSLNLSGFLIGIPVGRYFGKIMWKLVPRRF
ncbi:MAG TPA: VanZ family protein [Bacteroidales bacterium]|nr:VanZ family protein [Bacteroidales bacterium]